MIKRILITGSTGMLGADLCAALSGEANFKIFGIGRKAPDIVNAAYSYTPLDLNDSSAFKAWMRDNRPDLVIHTTGFTKVDLCESQREEAERENVKVVENVADACRDINAGMMFFSSDYVFSGNKRGEYKEDDPVEPINFYGETKARAEKFLRENSPRHWIFRVTWLYGDNGNHFPKAILKQAEEKSVIPVVSDQYGRPTWTWDIAAALSSLLASRQDLLDQYNKNTFHIGNEGTVNWSGFAREILDLSDKAEVDIREITSQQLNRPAKRPGNSVLSLEKAKKLLGIKMRPWQGALEEFLGVDSF